MDLFEHSRTTTREGAPLADRMRPDSLAEMVGQSHLLGEGKLLRSAIAERNVPSMVLWGPPGTGKTTLARVIAHETRARFETLSAVLSGVAELRAAIKQAREQLQVYGKRPLLCVDEIHLIVGAGTSEGSPVDVGNLLKPALSRGHLWLVGKILE